MKKFEPNKIANALQTIDAAEEFLKKRAEDAGLHLTSVSIHLPWRGAGFTIHMHCGDRVFDGGSKQPVSSDVAHSLMQFDDAIATGIARLEKKKRRI